MEEFEPQELFDFWMLIYFAKNFGTIDSKDYDDKTHGPPDRSNRKAR